MDFRSRLLEQLRSSGPGLRSRRCFVGFDGFVDTIVSAVATRSGQGERFTPFPGIAEFGRRIADAAGKSTNIELYPLLDKLGGNGPIMAGALASLGPQVTCVGAFGRAPGHPVFAELGGRARLVSLCEPARTTAVEFPDGKLMLGMMRSLDGITPQAIEAALGADGYRDALAVDLAVFANWTMIPNMTAIFSDLTGRVLPAGPNRPDRIFFFDLADPEKRSRSDLNGALDAIAAFGSFGRVTLGLNLKEAEQVGTALGAGPEAAGAEGLKALASRIRERLGLATVVIHPRESAACATRDGAWWVPGPFVAKPLITTGAGDHFNAGFAAGQLLGLEPESCLGLGVGTSGHYVRTGRSPSVAELETLLADWSRQSP
jgi:sugar/nucleoside kinase (ribokinase family)